MQVISKSQLPSRSPAWPTIIMLLVFDYYQIGGVVLGVALTAYAIWWLLWAFVKWNEEPTKINL